MSATSRRFIEFDAKAFHPRRIMPVTHNLVGHPLLERAALLKLAERLSPKQVRFHAATTTAGSSMQFAVQEHAHTMTPLDALANMETSGSWLALHNVQTDPEYRALLDAALDGVRDQIGDKDPGMFHRAFWIFIGSPNSVTPFHLDHEQNFLMQIQGNKTARVWYPEQCGSAEAVELYLSENSTREIPYRESFNEIAHKFDLVPGRGVFMPSTCPHLVNNSDNVSVTVSMTYCTAATERKETLSRGNMAMRRLGLKPTAAGKSPVIDAMKYPLFKNYIDLRARLRGEDLSVPVWARY